MGFRGRIKWKENGKLSRSCVSVGVYRVDHKPCMYKYARPWEL